MKSIDEIFYEKIIVLHKLATCLNFDGATTLSTNMITTSIMFEYSDGVFIAEIFEGIFDQLNKLTSKFNVADSDKAMLKESFDKNIIIIAESFRTSEKTKLYLALSSLRYDTTMLQYKCFQNSTMKTISINPFETRR